MDSLVPIILAVLGSGGFLGGIYALMKLRPEAGQITVSAAQGAVIVQTGVIETLREELARAHSRIAALEARARVVEALEERVAALEQERTRLLADNARLRERVKHLEADLAAFKAENTKEGP